MKKDFENEICKNCYHYSTHRNSINNLITITYQARMKSSVYKRGFKIYKPEIR